jgi:hypothetical protein
VCVLYMTCVTSVLSVCLLSIWTQVVLFGHHSVHKVVTMWWHDSTELGVLLVTVFVGVVIRDVPGVQKVALLRL